MMEHYKKIQKELIWNRHFIPQSGCNGRRFYLIKSGVRLAYIVFKWSLNGWNLYWLPDSGKAGSINLNSVDHLLRTCKVLRSNRISWIVKKIMNPSI